MSTLLDSNDSFTHLWNIWRVIGIYPHSNRKWFYTIYSCIAVMIGGVLSPLFATINLYFQKDIGLWMTCLQISPALLVAAAKHFALFLLLSQLQNVKTYLFKLDRRVSRNKEELHYVNNMIKQCRFITLGIMSSFVLSLSSYAVIGLIRRRLVFETWYPFDWTSSETRYLLTFLYQLLSILFQAHQDTASDGFSLVHMIVIKGHIHALCMRVARIGKDPNTTQDENYEELTSCVDDHKTILSLFEDVKPVVSLTVLMQFLVTAFILCVTAVNFLIFDSGVYSLIITVVYGVAVLAEAFPVCFLGNALWSEIDFLTTAIYSCNWMDQPMKFRKCIIIFMQRSQINDPILAGKLVPITLQTFIDIIRCAFSLFTFLSEMH